MDDSISYTEEPERQRAPRGGSATGPCHHRTRHGSLVETQGEALTLERNYALLANYPYMVSPRGARAKTRAPRNHVCEEPDASPRRLHSISAVRDQSLRVTQHHIGNSRVFPEVPPHTQVRGGHVHFNRPIYDRCQVLANIWVHNILEKVQNLTWKF